MTPEQLKDMAKKAEQGGKVELDAETLRQIADMAQCATDILAEQKRSKP